MGSTWRVATPIGRRGIDVGHHRHPSTRPFNGAVVTATAPIEVRRSSHRLGPDPGRVLANLFIPGQEGLIEGESRAGSVADRVLGLDDTEAAATLAEVEEAFAERHADLYETC